MGENTDGSFSFDLEAPPINPLTLRPIETWYKPGQTWDGQFEDLATTVEECRAELVGAYLMDDPDVLSLIGLDNESDITFDDCSSLSFKCCIALLTHHSDVQRVSTTWSQGTQRSRKL